MPRLLDWSADTARIAFDFRSVSVSPQREHTDEVREIACEVAARRLWDYIDGRLSPMSRKELDRHLSDCSGCPRFVASAELLREALANMAEGTAATGVPDECGDLRARVVAALHDVGLSRQR